MPKLAHDLRLGIEVRWIVYASRRHNLKSILATEYSMCGLPDHAELALTLADGSLVIV